MKIQHSISMMAILSLVLMVQGCEERTPGQPYGEVINGSIESVDADNTPEQWTVQRGGRFGQRTEQSDGSAIVDAEVKHDGSYSLRIESVTAPPPWWRNRVIVEPFSQYRLTGWVKTENVATTEENRGAGFRISGMDVVSGLNTIHGTQDWTRIEATFNTEGNDSFYLDAVLGDMGGGQDSTAITGKAWFDDVSLELVSGGTYSPSITINALKETGPIMNDRIYGQFIEHLGRCIYGGIWAEMLSDRKFYAPVGETQRSRSMVPSAWMAVGGENSVIMVTNDPYVGEHTPEVDLGNGGTPRGIIQSADTPAGEEESQRVERLTGQGAQEIPDLGPGLGIIEGKEYIGYVILSGDPSSAPIEVSLIWGEGPGERQTTRIDDISDKYVKYPVRFTAGATTDNASFQIVGRGSGKFRIGPPSLMPADNIDGMRADTIALLKDLDAPIYRWPGGNFVSGYDWKDGIGDRDKRPPRKNPAWQGIEHNDFGMHEFFRYLELVNAEPFIALNAGLGSAQSAVEEVQYVNGSADTPMGKLRVENGGPIEPWSCTYWAVGNEMSGSWQLGNVPLEEFIERHNEFSRRLIAEDPGIKLIASGEAANPRPNNWDRQLLAGAADNIHLNSKHFYRQDYSSPGGLMSHARQIADSVRWISESHRDYLKNIPEIENKKIMVSLDEWNFWYGPHVFGELGTRYFLRDAIGMAGGINEYSRNSDVIEIACVAQTVNVIGMIKTDKTDAVMDSSGLALEMYRKYFGYIPIEVSGTPEPLDIAATWTKDRSALTISVVNMTWEPHTLQFSVQGADLAPEGTSYVLTSDDDMNYNQPGEPMRVEYTRHTVRRADNQLEIAPVSATIFVFPRKE